MAEVKPIPTWHKSREISERIVVEGTLVLETPASLGNGDAEGVTDMPLLTDPLEGRALLTGASIAGALRNYLRERLLAYGVDEFVDENGKRNVDAGKLPIVTRLFGSLDDDGEQSHLIVNDALGTLEKPVTELRDGVRIKGETRTAYIDEKGKGAKFDLELLQAGTKFKLRFELLISDHPKAPPREDLIAALATALQGFETAEIHLGARKRRGYGQCRVHDWTVTRYVLRTRNGLLAWLSDELEKPKKTAPGEIAAVLKEACELKEEDFGAILETDKRAQFTLTAQFELDGSLLIRSGTSLIDEQGQIFAYQPDTVHLHAKHVCNGEAKYGPVLPGTSLAGVLCHRAFCIANTIASNGRNEKVARDRAKDFVDQLFGADIEEQKKKAKGQKKSLAPPFASRLEVRETVISTVQPLIQNRIRIDRFTGGVYGSALFNEAPVFYQGGKPGVKISLSLRAARLKKNGKLETDEEFQKRTSGEIGLLLLLLKDLWTADLAIGGESSIGRGRLRGIEASLAYRAYPDSADWNATLREESQPDTPDKKRIAVDGTIKENRAERPIAHADLEKFVEVLHRQLGKGAQSGE